MEEPGKSIARGVKRGCFKLGERERKGEERKSWGERDVNSTLGTVMRTSGAIRGHREIHLVKVKGLGKLKAGVSSPIHGGQGEWAAGEEP